VEGKKYGVTDRNGKALHVFCSKTKNGWTFLYVFFRLHHQNTDITSACLTVIVRFMKDDENHEESFKISSFVKQLD
jgi:hypothetical protein